MKQFQISTLVTVTCQKTTSTFRYKYFCYNIYFYSDALFYYYYYYYYYYCYYIFFFSNIDFKDYLIFL